MNLGQGLNEYVNSHVNSRLLKGMKLQQAWEKLAPSVVLDHTDNVVESKKGKDCVAIFVDTPHLAAELSMNKEYYRQMMEVETGYTINDMFFIVSKETGIKKNLKKAEEKKPWYQDNCESVPLDESELEYIKLSVSGIEDEKLKEMLFNAFVSDMEWKKGIKAQKASQK